MNKPNDLTCACRICLENRKHIMNTDEWRKEHDPHGRIDGSPLPDAPDYYQVLKCKCGAVHITTK